MQAVHLIWKGLTIVPTRLAQQGPRTSALWVFEKIERMFFGVSPLETSRVAPYLFVGGQQYKRGLERMQAWGIAATLNLREESDDVARGVAMAHHLRLPTADDGAPTRQQLYEGVIFIREAVKARQGVYIHCAQGVGRAPTMAAAYLMSEGDNLVGALEKIKAVRPFIKLTPIQLARLAEWK